jgi:hypothetical protein
MRSAVTSTLVVLLAISVCEGKQKHCSFCAHTEANANDGPVFSTQIRSQFSGKTAVIGKMPAISENGRSVGALFELDDHGRLALDTLSIEGRGRYLLIFVNDRQLAELQIDRRVPDGKVYLASGPTSNDIHLMKKEWRLTAPRKK